MLVTSDELFQIIEAMGCMVGFLLVLGFLGWLLERKK